MANRILTRVTPSLDGAAASLGDNSRSLALKIPSGEYDTPLWVRTEAGLVVKVDSLPWQGVLPAGAIEVLSADPAGGGGGSFDFSEDWPTIGATNVALLGSGTMFQSVPGSSGPPARAIRIVAAPAEWEGITPNVMEVECVGANGDGFVRMDNRIPEATPFAFRQYTRVVPGNTHITFHSTKLCVGASPTNIQQVLFAVHGPFNSGTTYKPFINVVRSPTGQKGFEGPTLPQGPFHRFEWFVQPVSVGGLTFRTWARVYNMDKQLIHDSSSWITSGAPFSGSLTDYWNVHGAVATASSWDEVRQLADGYEGPGGGSQPGAFWNHAAAAVKLNPNFADEPWVGPHPNN